jgi:hypothetical protein
VLPEDHVSVHPATEGQSARVQARSRHRTIGPRGRCRRRGRSFREDGHEPGCRLVGVPASALEGMGIECAPFKRQEDHTRPGAGGDGVVEKTEKGRSTSERFWLPACPGVKAQHGDQLDFGRTPTVSATECRSAGTPPSAPGVSRSSRSGRWTRAGLSPPPGPGAGPFNATVRPYARRSRVWGISLLEPTVSLLRAR